MTASALCWRESNPIEERATVEREFAAIGEKASHSVSVFG
jgi:hypothetical protein